MRKHSQGLAAGLAAIVLSAAGLAVATPASAATPATVTQDGVNHTAVITVSDTVLEPGESFTVQTDFTNKTSSTGPAKLAIFVTGSGGQILDIDSCTGPSTITTCAFDGTRYILEFPIGPASTETATITFDVRSDAPASKRGLSFESGISGATTSGPSIPIDIVEPPAEADLGV
ncbi:hypothetical protein, partial [Isoptericola aurantiacus]|uniref:hypothetical protein n=1 Tax=Isoptericola aurantiacus TaxID=3377839 RepID=UPI00383A5A66